MRTRWRILITLLLLAAAGAGGWYGLHREELRLQWDLYRVGTAATVDEARRQLAAFDRDPDREQKLRLAMGKWGTGNLRYDYYLARYVGHADSSERARELFAYELGWREGLMKRWAHFWSWQADDPSRQGTQLLGYLDLLVRSKADRLLPWREVLNLQAVFELSGDTEAALRMSPEDWRARYVRWRAQHPGNLPPIPRPSAPYTDWSGPVPP